MSDNTIICNAGLIGRHVNFNPSSITHCCSLYTPICEYKGENSFPIDKYLQSCEHYIRHNNACGSSICSYCQFSERSESAKPLAFTGFDFVTINNFNKCQLNCVYCHERKKYGSISDPYPIFPAIKDLYEKNLLKMNAVFSWGGGEITLYRHYAEPFEYLLERGMFQIVHSNCIIFSQLFVDALKTGKLEMRVSIDSGTPETYKKVKGADCYDKVWANIEQYCSADTCGRVILKYIILQHNMNKRDYNGFIAKCVQANVKNIIISADLRTYKPQVYPELVEKYIEAARELYHLAIQNNFKVDFLFWTQEDIQRIIITKATDRQRIKDIVSENEGREQTIFSGIQYKNTRYDQSANIEAMEKSKDKIEKVLSLLQDERSKDIFRNELLSREKMKDMMPPILIEPINEQYFDREIIRPTDNEIFIDAGAYDGMTTALFLQIANSPHTKAYLLEPDPAMYNAMLEKMKTLNDDNLEFINKGLSDKSGTEKFLIRPIGSSRIDPDGTEVISTVALDDLVMEATFIKMDIEGTEVKALLGAKNVIRKCKPKLAIAIYHNVDDLWEIPLLINSLNPEYRLYVRKYEGAAGYFLNEVVCYAVPVSN